MSRRVDRCDIYSGDNEGYRSNRCQVRKPNAAAAIPCGGDKGGDPGMMDAVLKLLPFGISQNDVGEVFFLFTTQRFHFREKPGLSFAIFGGDGRALTRAPCRFAAIHWPIPAMAGDRGTPRA